MADTTALKNRIRAAIKANDNQEITGPVLQQALLDIVDELDLYPELQEAINTEKDARQSSDGQLQQAISSEAQTRQSADTQLNNLVTGIKTNIDNGYVYAGIATPSTIPVSGKVFYLALTAGTYTNFGNTTVTQGINILKYNGSAWSLDAFVGIDDTPTQGSNNLVKSGGVLDSIIKDGSAFDLSAYNSGATYADLSAALTALNALPAAYKKGGMSFKYVQTSDNKYMQFRLMTTSFSTTVSDWQGVDDEPTAGSDNLVKSGGVAKIYGKYINNPKFVRVYTDADGKIVWAIKTDGSIYYGAGVPQQVIDYIEEKIKNLSLDEYEDIVAFLNGLAEGDKTLQTLLNEKFDKVNVAQELGDSEEKVVSQFALPFKIVENSKYLYAIVDATNHFIAGIKKDGSIEWSKGIPTPIKVKLEAIIEQNKLDIDNKINLGSNIYPANIQSVTENKKYKEVLFDKDKKIIRGINKDNEEEIYLPQNLFGIKTTSLIENANYLDILYSRDGRMLASRNKNGMLSEYAGVNAPFFLKNGEEIRTLSYEDTIYVAAKDSDDVDKASADYICDGINDEEEINEAIVALKKRSGTRYKKVILLSGHYYIDSFTEVLGDWKSAIAFHSDKGMLGDSLTISGISHYYRSTVIYVTEKALNSIADNTKYSVIMCMPSTKDNSVVRFDVQNIMIALANNQHPIVAINLQYGDCGECKNIYMTASGLYDNSEVGINSGISARDNAVEGVVALRSYHGYTIGDTVRFDNICAFGFYTAFQLGCEHAIYNNLRSRFCHTGYTFGEYHTELVRGAFDHPMTLINCCDEQSIQGPVFAWNGLINSDLLENYPNETDRKLQSVTFIDFNYETPSRKAYEVEPGTFCGLILYHPSDGTFGGRPDYSFWKEGSGKNFTTINLTQANGGTSELRESYGAHYMQHFFDTDLNKETIFNGTNWVDCLGNIV